MNIFDTEKSIDDRKQTFDIKYIEQEHKEDVIYKKIQCEHVNYRLQDGAANTHKTYT